MHSVSFLDPLSNRKKSKVSFSYYVHIFDCRPLSTQTPISIWTSIYLVNKGRFLSKLLAKVSNFSKCHSGEPKIDSEFLISVNDNNKILVILWNNLVIKSSHYKCKLNGRVYLFTMLAELWNYWLYPKYIFE